MTSIVPTGVHLSPANAHYLATKAQQGLHTIDLPAVGSDADPDVDTSQTG